jgi:membrane protein implicated in regulation of membrane protease activity
MLGARALALERIDIDSGLARIGEEVWSARTTAEELVIEEGTVCEVVSVSGVYAYLEPHAAPADDDPGERGPTATEEESK